MENPWSNIKGTERTHEAMSNEYTPYPTMDKYIIKPEEEPTAPTYNPWNMMPSHQE